MKVYDPRATLEDAARKSGTSLSRLSRMLGRNAAYLQQFVKRGTPDRLSERDRRILADYLGVDEIELGAQQATPNAIRRVPRLDVRASAGPGALPDAERPLAEVGLDKEWLRHICGGRDGDVSFIRVEGDSMAPTLMDGDDILVDRAEASLPLRDGIYVLRRDGALSVKRLGLNPATGLITIASDNPAHPTWHDCDPASIDVIGRVVWAGRRFT